MRHAKPTGYGWLIKLPNGELREYVTDEEAYEAYRDMEEELASINYTTSTK